MIESKPRTEMVDQKPFVIRGHHLATYAQLFKRNYRDQKYPSSLAKEIRTSVQTESNTEYAKDVYGTSVEAANEAEYQQRRTFETFLTLPDNYPMEIVEGTPDAICATCVIGKHCRKLSDKDSFFKFSSWKGDGIYMDNFLKKLNDLHLPEPIIIEEQVLFSYTQSQKARRVKTTAGIARRVIEKQALPSLAILLLKRLLRRV